MSTICAKYRRCLPSFARPGSMRSSGFAIQRICAPGEACDQAQLDRIVAHDENDGGRCRPCAKPASITPEAAKAHDRPEPPPSATDPASAAVEAQPIRERVKELTSQVLQQGRVDPEAVREVASTILGRTPGSTAVTGAR